MTIILGIDPGKSGGMAMIFEGGGYWAQKMPPTEKDIWELISGFGTDVVCYIEHVHGMPGEGVSSVGKFMYGYGGLRMALVAAGIRTELVIPAKWCKALGLVRKKNETGTNWKNRHKSLSQRLFPSVERMTHAISDALLIAHYGSQRMK